MTGAWNKVSRLRCTDLPVIELISIWEPASHSRSCWTSMAPNAQFREACNQLPFIVKQLSYLLTHIMYHSNCRVVFYVGGDILLTDGIIPSVSKIAPPISLWNDFSPRPLNRLLMIRHTYKEPLTLCCDSYLHNTQMLQNSTLIICVGDTFKTILFHIFLIQIAIVLHYFSRRKFTVNVMFLTNISAIPQLVSHTVIKNTFFPFLLAVKQWLRTQSKKNKSNI